MVKRGLLNGGGEGNRTPVQIALLIQASTVYSVNDNQVWANRPTLPDLSDWIVEELRTDDWFPYPLFLLPNPSPKANPVRHATPKLVGY